MKTELEFRARERHPYFYVGTAFGLCFVARAVMAFATNVTSPINELVGLFALGFGGAVLTSAAYAAHGRLRVEREDGWCTVRWLLGPWSRSKRFPVADVRNVRRYTPPPFAMMWPSIAGIQLRVDVSREARSVDIGGGFMLDDTSLVSIANALGASI